MTLINRGGPFSGLHWRQDVQVLDADWAKATMAGGYQREAESRKSKETAGRIWGAPNYFHAPDPVLPVHCRTYTVRDGPPLAASSFDGLYHNRVYSAGVLSFILSAPVAQANLVMGHTLRHSQNHGNQAASVQKPDYLGQQCPGRTQLMSLPQHLVDDHRRVTVAVRKRMALPELPNADNHEPVFFINIL